MVFWGRKKGILFSGFGGRDVPKEVRRRGDRKDFGI
jgi:hypothetical protein